MDNYFVRYEYEHDDGVKHYTTDSTSYEAASHTFDLISDQPRYHNIELVQTIEVVLEGVYDD